MLTADTTDERGPKERAYDEIISPRIVEIIAACKEAGISIHAAFRLDGDLACTTHIAAPESQMATDEEREARRHFLQTYEPMARRATEPACFAYTITRAPKEVR